MAKRRSYVNVGGGGRPRANWWKQALGVDYYANQSEAGPPTVQASNLVFSNFLEDGFRLSCTRGNGAGIIIFAKEGGAVDEVPEDEQTYTAGTFGEGSELGTGNFCVHNGSDAFVDLTDLNPALTYHFEVFEKTGTTYLTTGDQNTASTLELAEPDYYDDFEFDLDPSTIAQADGTEVAAYTDAKSGITITPSASNRRPTLETNELNGLPIIRVVTFDNFVGVKTDFDFLHSGDSTIVMVVNTGVDNATRTIFDSCNNAAASIGRNIQIRNTAQLRDSCFAGDAGLANVFQTTTANGFFPTGSWRIAELTYEAGQSGNDHEIEVDNVLAASGQGTIPVVSTTSTALPNFFRNANATGDWMGDIARICMWSRKLTLGERAWFIGGTETEFGL